MKKKRRRREMRGKSILVLAFLVLSIVRVDSSFANTVPTEDTIYWATCWGESIKKASISTGKEEVVVSGTNLSGGIALDAANGKIYWSGAQPQGIYRANLDGTNKELLVGPDGPSGLCDYDDIALDLTSGKLYYTEGGIAKQYYKLRRADLNGSNIENVIPTSNLTRPNGLALDLFDGKVYWGEGALGGVSGKIRRANLDGTNIEDLIAVGVNTPRLTLDLSKDKMYWINNNEGQLWRANIDGTSPELLASGLVNPLGLALDTVNGNIYYSEFATGTIKKANLDGTNVTDFLATEPHQVEGLAIYITPEPSTVLLLGLGGLLIRKRRALRRPLR
jgi:sugar lactone lactonase YvrE